MDSEIKPKADVGGVELTEKEKMFLVHEYNLNGYSLLGVLKEIESIIHARLTALQSAHDVEVKELERKILEAIPKEVETLKADLDYLHQVGYNEAIAEITRAIENIVGEGK